jgi:hypothetical protein
MKDKDALQLLEKALNAVLRKLSQLISATFLVRTVLTSG